MANFKENEWDWHGNKFSVKEGQFVTSLESIAEKSGKGITVQNVRTALKRFEKFGFLTNESTKSGRVINIENWAFYQGVDCKPNKANNKDLTNNQQRPNKDLTPNKESNKDKKDNKEINNEYTQQVEQLWSLYPNKKGKAQAIKQIPKLIDTHGYEAIERCIISYANECRGKDMKYVKHGSTFFNSGYVDYLENNHIQESNKEPYIDQETGEVCYRNKISSRNTFDENGYMPIDAL